MSDCLLLHFDSHSDLSIPKNLSKDDVFKKDVLFSKLSIENWILPAAFAGHIGTIVWIRPPWTQESFEAFSTFKVGYHPVSNEIRVSSKSNYFLSELSYAAEEQLSDSKTLILIVLPVSDENLTASDRESHLLNVESANLEAASRKRKFDELEHTEPGCSRLSSVYSAVHEMKQNYELHEIDCVRLSQNECNRSWSAGERCYDDGAPLPSVGKKFASKDIGKLLASHSDRLILDIDLDFFSTTNPLQTKLTAKQRNLVESLYAYVPPVDQSENSIQDCLAYRQEQMAYFEAVFTALHNNKPITLGDAERDQDLQALIEDFKHQSSSEEADFLWLHDIGSGIDDCDLPHHISSDDEIDSLISRVEQILLSQPRPTVITIARSSSDDYCPLDQVEHIQSRTLDMLSRIYGNLDIKLTYQ